MGSLISSFGRSKTAIFACSLATSLVLGVSSLVYLELMSDKRGEPYQAGALTEASGDENGEPQPTTRREIAGTGTTIRTRREDTSRETRESRELTDSQEGAAASRKEHGKTDEVPVVRELESDTRNILSRYPGSYGVVLWQPESGTRMSLDTDKRFRSASLAKLPVLLALYQEAAEGRLSLDERIEVSASDIQPGTGVLQYRRPGTTMTLRECAEYLIKESDNTAWAMLEDRLGKERIRAELVRVGAESTRYEYARHTTTPDDTLKMLQKISDPGYTSPSHSQEMLDTMTGTAFEDRLPQGLPPDARIHHKIGSLGDNFGDAGLVVPPEDKESGGPYYIVVLSGNAGGEAKARSAMREISLAAYQGLVDPKARPRSPIPGAGLGPTVVSEFGLPRRR